MIIENITLENIGLIYGKYSINLKPKLEAGINYPIIVIGGKNGVGKTTIFEAIRLCLYGKNNFLNFSQKQYEKYLKDLIHYSKNLTVQPNYSRIEITFQYAQFGEVNNYLLKREWELVNGKVKENFTILKNQKELEEIDKDNWQDFINDLIPIGLSELFFFDGEKIQKIITASNNDNLMNSIKRLIGIDIFERLNADIKIYKQKKLKKEFDAQEQQKLKSLIQNQSDTEACIKKEQDRISVLENRIKRLEDEVKGYENKILAQGGGFAQKKEQMIQQKKVVEKDIDILKEDLKGIASGLLPVVIAQKPAKNFKNQLLAERKRIRFEEAENLLKNKSDTILNEIKNKPFWDNVINNNKSSKDIIINELSNCFSSLNLSSEYKDIKIEFGLSKYETIELINTIDYSINKIPEKIIELVNDYEKKYRKLQKIYSNLEKVPEDELIGPMFEKLKTMNKKLGGYLNQKENIEIKLKNLTNRLNDINRKIELMTNKKENDIKTDYKISLVNQTEKILNNYLEKLTSQKVEMIQTEFIKIFNELHRKEDLINYIIIDPVTFEVLLYDESGHSINKNDLSSGELEIYAMSMLWTLIRTSGRNLPFIIDTPLGRLDGDHRMNLIHKFFPKASHQMIIFSTDTEIDKKLLKELEPYISNVYRLDYDKYKRHTEIKEGYFWNK